MLCATSHADIRLCCSRLAVPCHDDCEAVSKTCPSDQHQPASTPPRLGLHGCHVDPQNATDPIGVVITNCESSLSAFPPSAVESGSNSTEYFHVKPLSSSPVPVKANSFVIPIALPLLFGAVEVPDPETLYVALAVPVTSTTPALADVNKAKEPKHR